MPLLGLLSRLVSAPPEKPQRAQNEAHTAPQQRYGFPIVSTWLLRTGNTLTLPQSTNQWGILTQNAPSSVSTLASRAHHLRSHTCPKTKHTRHQGSATASLSSVLGPCTQEAHLPCLKVPTSGDSLLKMPLLGLFSSLVSAPPEKSQLAQNEAHTAPQQRYGFHMVSA